MRSPRILRFLAVNAFWILQAGLTLLAWPILFFGGLPTDADEWLAIAGVLLTLMVLQSAFILPAAPPSRATSRTSPPEHTGRALLGGLAVGTLAGWAGFAFLAALTDSSASPPAPLPAWLRPWPLWAGVVLISPVASLILLRTTRAGASIRLSIIIAAAAAALVVGAIAAAAWSLAGMLLNADGSTSDFALLIVAALLLSWLVATPLLAAYARRLPASARLHRFASILFGGTILTTAAIMPLDVMVRRKTDCYCGEGTFFSLTFCWAAGLIVFGPAIFLLPAGRRHRREIRGQCHACGYDLRATPQLALCPECGVQRSTLAPKPPDHDDAADRATGNDQIRPSASPRSTSI